MGLNAYAYLPFLSWTGYGIAAINMGFLYLIQRARLPYANLWSFHILFLTIPFVLLTSWPSDLLYISFAQGLLAWRLMDERNNIRKIRYVVLLLLLASIIFSSIFFFNFLFFNNIGNYHGYGFYGAIFWSVLLLLTATYVEIMPTALQQIRRMSFENPSLPVTASTGSIELR